VANIIHLLTHHVDLLSDAFVVVKYCEVGHALLLLQDGLPLYFCPQLFQLQSNCRFLSSQRTKIC